jgi:hypothetical protein
MLLMTPTLSSVAIILVNFMDSPERTNQARPGRNNWGADATNGLILFHFQCHTSPFLRLTVSFTGIGMPRTSEVPSL